MRQDDMVQLSIFAEQEFCIKCPVKNCSDFYNGKYENCQSLMAAFGKALDDHNAFLNGIMKPVIPGQCYQCRNDEINDKDHNYALITARKENKIHLHAWLCSVHLQELENTGLYLITKHNVKVI